MRRLFKLFIVCFSVVIVASCSDSATNTGGGGDNNGGDNNSGSTTGTVEVTASTSGSSQDSDGYTISLGDNEKDISVNGTVTFEDQEEGSYDAELSGIASNCSVEGDNPRSVEVTGGETTSTTFNVSCSASSEDAEENIQSSIDNTVTSLQNLQSGKFASSAMSFTGSSEWMADISTGMENIFMLESSQNRFDFASKTGVYEWDSSSNEFSAASSSENIVVKFPISESSSSNNAEFTVSEYSDAATTVGGEQMYLPTRIQSELKVDGESTFALNLNEMEYSYNSLPIPSLMDLEIYTAPFTHTLKLERTNDTDFSFSFDLSNGDQSTFGLSLDLELASSDYSMLQEEDLETLEGSIRFSGNLAVNFTVDDLGELMQLDNPSESTVNSLVFAEVMYNDNKVGELEYSAEEETVVIIYSDGSSEPIDQFYEDAPALLKTASDVKTSLESLVNIEN